MKFRTIVTIISIYLFVCGLIGTSFAQMAGGEVKVELTNVYSNDKEGFRISYPSD